MTRKTDPHHTRQCSHWIHSDTSPVTTRCTRDATHRLLVNGKPARNPYVCQEHGQQVVDEYARISEIVGTWTMEAIA